MDTEYHVITRYWHHGTSGVATNAVCTSLSAAVSGFLTAVAIERAGNVIPILQSCAFVCKSRINNSMFALWIGDNIQEDYHVEITIGVREQRHES